MRKKETTQLSRRERQIMDVIYARGKGSVSDVLDALPDPPSYSSVRALLRVLVDKGHLRYAEEAGRYIYSPVRSRGRAAREALRQVLHTFYGGSAAKTVAALLDISSDDLSEAELDSLTKMIEQAKQEGR
jgi:BlaI family transcriptional regulator, penicillinase repressor